MPIKNHRQNHNIPMPPHEIASIEDMDIGLNITAAYYTPHPASYPTVHVSNVIFFGPGFTVSHFDKGL